MEDFTILLLCQYHFNFNDIGPTCCGCDSMSQRLGEPELDWSFCIISCYNVILSSVVFRMFKLVLYWKLDLKWCLGSVEQAGGGG